MATPQKTLRNFIAEAIKEAQRTNGLPINNCEVVEAYYPSESLPDVPERGTVWIEHLTGDDELLTRDHQFERDIGIRITYQRLLRDTDPRKATDFIDDFDEQLDTLRDVVRAAVKPDARFNYQRIEGMRDDNDRPTHFMVLYQSNVLLGQFTLFVKTVLQ